MVDPKHPLTPPWPDPDAVVDLLDELRAAGYSLGIDHYIAAHDLLLALFAQAPVPEPQRLQSLLGPLLCSSPKEQAEFPQRFDNWLARWQMSHAPVSPTPKPQLTVEQHGWWRWVLVGMGLLVFVAIFYYFVLSSADTTTGLNNNVTTPAPAPTINAPIDTTTETWNYQWIWLSLFAILLLLSPFLLWQLWWFYRTHLFLMRHVANHQPELDKLTLKKTVDELFPALPLLQLAKDFRRRSEIPTHGLDITATINKTVQHAGWFTPVYGRRQVIPEYLVLIDRASRHDQQANFVTELIQRLETHKVFLHIYYFASDPRICFAADDREPPHRLPELLVRYPHHRLLLFTDARGLFNALTGKLEPWIEQLIPWTKRFLLTPEPMMHWGERERELADNFIILPATTEGLGQLLRALQQPPAFPEQLVKTSPPLPTMLLTRPQRWLDREPPSPPLLDELVTELRSYLGAVGFTWLSACAVYPALDWQLTLYLGNTLITDEGEKYLQPERLLELARLPWLRYNYMPDWLRKRLLQALPPDADRTIRDALRTLLLTAIDEDDGVSHLELARHRPFDSLTQPLRHFLNRQANPDNPLRDYIFLNFMIRKRSYGLAFALPAPLLTLLINKRSQIGTAYIPNFLQRIRERLGNQWLAFRQKSPEIGKQFIPLDPPSIDQDENKDSVNGFGPFRYHIPDSAPFYETRMSLLWLAEVLDANHRPIGEKVVLKVARLKEEQFSLANQRAIENEVRWLRQLDHPGIIKLRPIADTEVGLGRFGKQIYQARSSLPGEPWFLVTDYLPGDTLQHLVQERKKLTVALALQIAYDLAETLVYVHAQGCVHRDIKPHNVLFAQKPPYQQLTRQSRPILFDFGIANQRDEQQLVAGTRPWLAPEREQAMRTGAKLSAEPSIDIYALGLILYYMLTGKRPPTVTLNLAPQLLVKPQDLIDVPRQRRTALSIDLNQLIHKTIDNEPSKRPSAQQFVEEIQRLLPHSTISASSWPMQRWAWISSVATITALGVVLLYMLSTISPEIQPVSTSTATISTVPTLVATNTIVPTTTLATVASDNNTTAIVTTVAPNNFALTLVQPLSNLLSGVQTFSWVTNITLAENQAFELVFWEVGQDPMVTGFGLVGSWPATSVSVDLDRFAASTQGSRLLIRGRTYQWGVLLVETVPYRRLQHLGGNHTFIFGPADGGISNGVN